jgi:hypothetical protein
MARGRIATTIWSLSSALVFWSSCREAPPKRPANVPGAAILAPGGKVGGWWHYCEFDKNDDHAHCTIWNKVGLVLYEGVFLPLDRKPLGADELKVEYNERWGDNAQFICLGNGRILVIAYRNSPTR